MIEQQIRDLFAETADGESAPPRVDIQAARQRGRARLRWRRAGLAGTAALAAAAVLIVAVIPSGRGSAPSPAGPAAPRQFNPLVTNISFGWLPAGLTIEQGLTEPTVVLQGVGGGTPIPSWAAEAYARGQCHLTGSASGLDCGGGNDSILRLEAPAPAIDGHRAFWGGSHLVWEYARGGWAFLSIPVSDYAGLKAKPVLEQQALRIAANLRIGGASSHLVFPARFTGLTGRWRIAELHYYAEDGALQAQEFTLISDASRFLPHVGDLGIWTNAAYVGGHPATSGGTCSPDDPSTQNTREVINGYHMVVKRGKTGGVAIQEICGAHAGGLWFDIEEFGTHPVIGVVKLFRDHVQLLGRNPAHWTQNPLG